MEVKVNIFLPSVQNHFNFENVNVCMIIMYDFYILMYYCIVGNIWMSEIYSPEK